MQYNKVYNIYTVKFGNSILKFDLHISKWRSIQNCMFKLK